MPPHQVVVDVDCLGDNNMFDDTHPPQISPLFRDDNDNSGHSRGGSSSGPVVPPVTPSTPCRLLRRQANPEFAAVIAVCPSRERTISTEDYYLSSSSSPAGAAATPITQQQRKHPVSRQSRITEIIGPESAYVNTSSSSSSSYVVVGGSSLTRRRPSVPPTSLNSGSVTITTTTTTTDETKTSSVLPHKSDTPSSSAATTAEEEEKKKNNMVSPSNDEVGNLRSQQKQSSLFRRFMPKLKRVKGVSLPLRSLVK